MSDGRNESPRDLVPEFAKLVKQKREERDWSRHELARQAKISVTTVCDIEDRRRSPSFRVALRLGRALGFADFDIDDMLRGVPEPEDVEPAKPRKPRKKKAKKSDREVPVSKA